jgi:hypothetical protein
MWQKKLRILRFFAGNSSLRTKCIDRAKELNMAGNTGSWVMFQNRRKRNSQMPATWSVCPAGTSLLD